MRIVEKNKQPTLNSHTMRYRNKASGTNIRDFSSWDVIPSILVVNPSAWGHLNPSSYCDVGRPFYGVFKLWSKLQRKK